MNPFMELQGVSKFFGQRQVLNEVSARFMPGRFYMLLGKNGAGKSTLMRILMRYEQPDKGKGWLFGAPLEQDRDAINHDIGYVSESIEFALPVKLQRLFALFPEVYPRWEQKIFTESLDALGIRLDGYFKELSRGQKMQVAFAAALAIKPKVLLLDEITAVLDVNARAYFMDRLQLFRNDGGTVVMATNIVSEVQGSATDVLFLHDGRIRLNSPMSELAKLFRKLRKRPIDRSAIFDHPACIEVSLNSDGSSSYVLPFDLAARAIVTHEQWDQRGITAEEVFIYLTRVREGLS